MLVQFLIVVSGFVVMVGGFFIGITSSLPVILGVTFFLGALLWGAYNTLDFACPRCSYNLLIDLMRPFRALLWFSIFFDPVICPNCKLNLSIEPEQEVECGIR
jgi:hypothetical protein